MMKEPMSESLNPSTVPAPAGPYSQAIVVTGPGKWLHISGQIGVGADGATAEGIVQQTTLAWQNLVAVLAAAGMTVDHLVKVTTFLVDASHLSAVGPVRTRFLGSARPASTLVIVKELAKKEWLVEVEAVAFSAS
ncbi:Enamine/imine deaminase [Variovorax sp. PBL-E5]|nr:Enamine/imine deaminase [Variovorax sp. PBL-E5]